MLSKEDATIFNMLAIRQPQVIAALYRKKLSELPAGYCHPKYFAVAAYDAACSCGLGINDTAKISIHFCTAKLAACGVPTFFIDGDLSRGLVKSNPPVNMRWADVKWPFPALLIIPNQNFSMEYVGVPIQHVAICRYESDETCPSPFSLNERAKSPTATNKGGYPHVFMSASVLEPGKSGSSVSAVYSRRAKAPNDGTIADFMEEFSAIKMNYGVKHADALEDLPEKDDAISKKLLSFSIHVILAMSAIPEFIHWGCEERKAKVKHGKSKPALWSPNFIGKGFVLRREGFDHGGTHASPRMHWRIGHWRHQAYGPGLSESKLIWIQPTIVNATEQEAA